MDDIHNTCILQLEEFNINSLRVNLRPGAKTNSLEIRTRIHTYLNVILNDILDIIISSTRRLIYA